MVVSSLINTLSRIFIPLFYHVSRGMSGVAIRIKYVIIYFMSIPQVSPAETEIILELFKATMDIPGDAVEFGCYKGDTSILLAQALKECGSNAVSAVKRLWLYDSFAGLPEKTAEDASPAGSEFKGGELLANKHKLLLRFKRANLPRPLVKKAFFKDLTPEDLPAQIAFAFLDGDLYDSIKDSLALVVPRLTGTLSAPTSNTARTPAVSQSSATPTIIIHDYQNPKLPGVTRAVDEFLTAHPSFTLTRRASLAIIK